MLDRIDRIMGKILPMLDREAREREKETNKVVTSSYLERAAAEDKVFAAYRKAGIAIAGHQSKRGYRD